MSIDANMNKLIERMKTFDGNYTGLMSETREDYNLTRSIENRITYTYPAPIENAWDFIECMIETFMDDEKYTRQEQNNARNFIMSYIGDIWDMNIANPEGW